MTFLTEFRWSLPLLWIAAVLVVWPVGAFPLNDDWSYALNVKHWLENRSLKFNDWAAMTQLTHVILGIVVTEITGFSFTALRFVNIAVVFFLLVWLERRGGLYGEGADRTELHLVLLFNPLFFSLAFTFMTDLTYLALLLVSMELIVREKWKMGSLAAVLATLTRQIGLGIGLSYLVYNTAFERGNRAKKAIMLTILLTVVLACYSFVFKHFGVISENYSTPGMLTWILNHQRPIARMGANAALIMVYLGLFVLPVIDFRKRADVWHLGLTAVLFGLTFTRFPMHWSGNLLHGWGIGPVEVTGGSAFVAPFPWMAHLLRLLGAYGGAVLLVTLFKKLFSSGTPVVVRWGIVMSGGYLFFLVINQFLFDRYVLMLVPFALYAVAWEGAPKHVENRIFLVLMALYSIIGTRNYLDWNRDRWDAVRRLQDKGVSPAEIDGGFEVNGWFQQKHLEPAEWVIGFNKPDGYSLEQRFSSGVCIFRKVTSDSTLQQ